MGCDEVLKRVSRAPSGHRFRAKNTNQIWYQLPYLGKKPFRHGWREIHFTKRANVQRPLSFA